MKPKTPPPAESDINKGQSLAMIFNDSTSLKSDANKTANTDKSQMYNTGNEIIAFYEKLISKAMEVRERIEGDEGIITSPILSDLHYIIEKNLVDKFYEYVMSAGSDR